MLINMYLSTTRFLLFLLLLDSRKAYEYDRIIYICRGSSKYVVVVAHESIIITSLFYV